MSHAYVDTSWLLATLLDEPGSYALSTQIARMERVFSSNLLEAELRAALAREEVTEDGDPLRMVDLVLPNRSLSPEIGRVLEAGALRGASLWHVAVALYVAETSAELTFLTLDPRQKEVAAALGFPTPG